MKTGIFASFVYSRECSMAEWAEFGAGEALKENFKSPWSVLGKQ